MIGTIKELSNRLRIGDQVLGQVELSVLTRLGQAAGWAKQVSKVRTVQGKGKPSEGVEQRLQRELSQAHSSDLVIVDESIGPVAPR